MSVLLKLHFVIQVWFQNHRAKYKRKEKKKETTQKSTVKLQPPSNWPSALPFDSSIASLGSSSTSTWLCPAINSIR